MEVAVELTGILLDLGELESMFATTLHLSGLSQLHLMVDLVLGVLVHPLIVIVNTFLEHLLFLNNIGSCKFSSLCRLTVHFANLLFFLFVAKTFSGSSHLHLLVDLALRLLVHIFLMFLELVSELLFLCHYESCGKIVGLVESSVNIVLLVKALKDMLLARGLLEVTSLGRGATKRMHDEHNTKVGPVENVVHGWSVIIHVVVVQIVLLEKVLGHWEGPYEYTDLLECSLRMPLWPLDSNDMFLALFEETSLRYDL